jgi:SAM-dependent methyltransferase
LAATRRPSGRTVHPLRPIVPMARPTTAAYREDLAYIHDTGFGNFAEHASPRLLDLLREHGFTDGLVIDLGCGSGIWARSLSTAGYGVLGYDISAAMVTLAQKRVPRGEFHQKSFLAARLRPCIAVTAIGEIFNYLFDKKNDDARLAELFERVHTSLRPGGLFIFDVATAGREPTGTRKSFTEGDDWACLFEAHEDPKAQTLVRRITTFRKVGPGFRRDREVHRLRLHDRARLQKMLCDVGFRVRTLKDYGKTQFPPGYVAFVAQKKG